MAAERQRIVPEFVYYWKEAGLDRTAVEEMRAELETHLEDAASHGEGADTVVSDLAQLAVQWAEARAGRRVPPGRTFRAGKNEGHGTRGGTRFSMDSPHSHW